MKKVDILTLVAHISIVEYVTIKYRLSMMKLSSTLFIIY